jgi:O-antigen/teichoic acid export membrane protein
LYVLDHGFGLKEMALVTTFANFFSLPFLLIAGKKLYPQLKLFSFGIHKERFLEIFKFGMGVFIARGGGQLNAYSHQLIIMWVLGPKFLGVFEMAMLLINNSIKLLETTQHVLYPRITKAGGLKDIASLRDIFLWQAKLTFFIGIGLFIGFIVYGKAFLDLWLGEHGQEAVSLLSIFSLAMLLSLFSSVSKMVLFGLGKVKVNIVFEYSYAIIEVILILVGLQLFGKSLEVFAFVALLDMSIGRGLIYTSFAIKQIKIDAVKYFLFFGFRVLLCSMTTYWAFTEIHRFVAFQSWYGFFQSIIICIGLYVVIAIFTLLKISELKIVTGKLFNYA